MTALYPEIGAGGFSRVDGSIAFFSRVNALLTRDMTLVEFGAGRGIAVSRDPVAYRRQLMGFRGKVNKVVGIDVDDAILTNPFLDEAYVVGPHEKLPLGNETVDLIVSDWTFEHIENPVFAVTELTRILKPGGWICARTPNRWGYIGLGAQLVPNKWHERIIWRLQPDTHRESEDVFPTTYKMNTMGAIKRLFPSSMFENYTYPMSAEPVYFGQSVALWHLANCILYLMPSFFREYLFVFLRKRKAS